MSEQRGDANLDLSGLWNGLYSYPAGAIFENKRDYPRAIKEYMKAVLEDAETGESPSYKRLVQLAGRRSTAAQTRS